MPQPSISFREAIGVWLRIAALSFGGPAGQIAVMHRVLVEEKRWLSESRFLHALNYCMLLPGPEAMQLVTYSGWLLHGVRGGLVAGLLFILPGFVSILLLSTLYAVWADMPLLEALFYGIKPAVVAVVFVALMGMARRNLHGLLQRIVALAAFVAMFVFAVPFPWIVLAAAMFGLLGTAVRRARPEPAVAQKPPVPVDESVHEQSEANGWQQAIRTGLTWLGVWLLPVAALWLWAGPDSLLTELAVFFSKLSLLTFGGAYAALAYMAQEAVQTHGWLSAAEMLDGLGLAESTPGPLIQVTQFVGYLAASNSTDSPSWLLGLGASVIVTWVVFAPSFLWIFLGAPFMERLRGNRWITGALGAVSAAVVGVILNLALWFALHVLFRVLHGVNTGALRFLFPEPASVDWVAVALVLLAFAALQSRRLGLVAVLAGCAALGAVLWLLGVAG